MAKATTLKRDLMKICEALEKRYARRKIPQFDDFIEALTYQILELAASERAARDALKAIKDEYVDWNDMRVATVREIQDILGPRYVRCREKAEDLSSLLADLYTAFRTMDLSKMVVTQEGIETLRALPDTTLIRADMVEWALCVVCNMDTFPTTEEQFELLKYLGGLPKSAALETHADKVVEALDREERLRLSRGLREHADFLEQRDIFDPKPIGFEWSKPDPLGMGSKPKRSSRSSSKAKKAATGGSSSSGGKSKKTSGASTKTSKKTPDAEVVQAADDHGKSSPTDKPSGAGGKSARENDKSSNNGEAESASSSKSSTGSSKKSSSKKSSRKKSGSGSKTGSESKAETGSETDSVSKSESGSETGTHKKSSTDE